MKEPGEKSKETQPVGPPPQETAEPGEQPITPEIKRQNETQEQLKRHVLRFPEGKEYLKVQTEIANARKSWVNPKNNNSPTEEEEALMVKQTRELQALEDRFSDLARAIQRWDILREIADIKAKGGDPARMAALERDFKSSSFIKQEQRFDKGKQTEQLP